MLTVVPDLSSGDQPDQTPPVSLLIGEIARKGARRMLVETLRAKIDAYIVRFTDQRDGHGRHLVVRNGYNQARQVLTSAGKIEVSAPRINDKRTALATGERKRFSSAILPPWCRKTPRLPEVLSLLYLHGLSSRDFVPAFGQFQGTAASLSASIITRLAEQWKVEHRAFAARDMSWADLLRDCGRRGMRADAGRRKWGTEVLGRPSRGVPAGQGTKMLVSQDRQHAGGGAQVGVSDNQEGHDRDLERPGRRPRPRSGEAAYDAKIGKAVAKVIDDIDELLAFYDFPAEHWIHLRTTKPIKSTFATVRHHTKVTKITKRPGSRAAGLAMAFKLIESAQARWRRVNARHSPAASSSNDRRRRPHEDTEPSARQRPALARRQAERVAPRPAIGHRDPRLPAGPASVHRHPPAHHPDDIQARGRGSKRADHTRTVRPQHWDYNAERIDGFDYDAGAVLIRDTTAANESELATTLKAWQLHPEQFLCPWQTDDPR